jgi:predicted site-specific integrase-resolvase
MNNLITLAEYAKIKKKSLKTVYNWIHSGKIKPVVIGTHKFIKYEK